MRGLLHSGYFYVLYCLHLDENELGRFALACALPNNNGVRKNMFVVVWFFEKYSAWLHSFFFQLDEYLTMCGLGSLFSQCLIKCLDLIKILTRRNRKNSSRMRKTMKQTQSKEVRARTATPGLHLDSFFTDLFPLCTLQAMLNLAYLSHGCHGLHRTTLKGVTIFLPLKMRNLGFGWLTFEEKCLPSYVSPMVGNDSDPAHYPLWWSASSSRSPLSALGHWLLCPGPGAAPGLLISQHSQDWRVTGRGDHDFSWHCSKSSL